MGKTHFSMGRKRKWKFLFTRLAPPLPNRRSRIRKRGMRLDWFRLEVLDSKMELHVRQDDGTVQDRGIFGEFSEKRRAMKRKFMVKLRKLEAAV